MKVFDHIDFNKFFEEKIKFDITQPEIKNGLCIEEVYLQELMLLEMAQGIVPGSSTRSAIRLDDDDIVYLYQFIPQDWSRALWWRYGPGLISYARQRHQHVEESADDDPNSNFHGVDKKGIPLPDEKPESIMFDEDILLGKGGTAADHLEDEPSLGDHEGKPKLGWMKPEGGYKKHHKLTTASSQSVSSKRKYDNINFGWNKLYHKLNLKYKFAMQRVDDSNWKEKGVLPNLAGYKPMNFKGVDDQLNQYFKGMGMGNHHPQDYHDQLKAAQQNMGQTFHGKTAAEVEAGYTTNDHIPAHGIIPLTHSTHTDGQWDLGRPSAHDQPLIDPKTGEQSIGKDGKPLTVQRHLHQNDETGDHYQQHMYSLMSKGLGRYNAETGTGVNYNSSHHRVQPYYVGSPKKGKYSTYNAYEVFGLHKAMKNQEWELEKYFPQEFHQHVFDRMKASAAGEKVKIGKDASEEEKSFVKNSSGISDKPRFRRNQSGGFDEQSTIDEFDEKLNDKNSIYRHHWKPLGQISDEQRKNYAGELKTDHQGYSYVKEDDPFFKYAQGRGGAENLQKWEWLFLSRYLSRFDQKSKNLTHNQHLAVTSAYKTIGAEDINKTIDAHPELSAVHGARDHKRSLNKEADKRQRLAHDEAGGTDGRAKHIYGKKDIYLSPEYRKHQEKEHPNSPTRTAEKDLPLASHTDVMVGGVVHKFGGQGGNVQEYNATVGKWQPIPAQNIFVPLLHRGQVLPSEKQLGKGINLGSFGHSQSAEVEVNHFGNDVEDDEFPVSKQTAERYGFPTDDTLSKRIMMMKSKDLDGGEQKELQNYIKMEKEKGDLCFINRNEYFWDAAKRGEQPSEEFFSSKDPDHNDVTRNTDHHQDHMKHGDDDEDGILFYDPDKGCSDKGQPKGAGNLAPVLRSVKDGVCMALAKIKKQKNSEALYDEMSSRISTLWGYGDQLLRANVSHPQFFKNYDYEAHLKRNEEDLPRDDDGDVDREALRKSGQKAEHTSDTGYKYRRMRVANYIRSFSQKGFGENVPYRRDREGQTEGFTRQVEDHDLNRIAKDRVNQRDQYEIAEKRKKGQHAHTVKEDWELPSAQNSFHRRNKRYAEAKKEAENKFNLKGGNEMVELENQSKDGNLALLALWAIQTKEVPRAREIAQIKHGEEAALANQFPTLARLPEFNHLAISKPVSSEVALAPDFNNSPEYKEAHIKQFKLAWAWAQSKIKKDWNERIKQGNQSGEGWYDGMTATIDDQKFIDFHKDKDPIDELFERSSLYDDKASFDLVKFGDDFESSGLVHDDLYKIMIDSVENAIPAGLFDFEHFERSMGELSGSIKGENDHPEEKVVTLAKVLYDHLLNSVNPQNVPSEKDWNGKLEEKVEENVLMFTDILEGSPFENVKSIARKFYDEYTRRVSAVKGSYSKLKSRSLSRYISSSAESNHHEGRTSAMQDYDSRIESAKKEERKSIKEKKHQYLDAWGKFSHGFNSVSFNSDSAFTKALLGSLQSSVEEKPEFKEEYIQAFEDAFVDQLVDHLNHETNFIDSYQHVKSLTQTFAKEGIFSKSFKKNVQNEVKRARDRHRKTAKTHGDVA
jgi:hypothetical protein